MKFRTVNLEEELQKIREKRALDNLVLDAYDILNTDIKQENRIKQDLSSKNKLAAPAGLKLDSKKIFTLDEIRKICILYRLRFLDSSLFKQEIPSEAILKIKALEKKHGVAFKNFKVVAPSSLFQLQDKDSDPLLFITISENVYYLVHKWGGDLSRWRSFIAFPFRNILTLLFTLCILAGMVAAVIPTDGFIGDSWVYKAYIFMYSLIALCGMATFLGFTYRQNFSDVEWNSRYFS